MRAENFSRSLNGSRYSSGDYERRRLDEVLGRIEAVLDSTLCSLRENRWVDILRVTSVN